MIETLRTEIEQLKADGLYRTLRTLFSSQGREIVCDGKMFLNFCSNDYLGLAADPRLVKAAGEAMERRGLGSGASRLVCGNTDEHALLERELAQFKGTEAALVFSSGYMANTGIIPALVGRDDAVYSDRLNHASIVDGIVLSRAEMHRYPHADAVALEAMLAKGKSCRRRLIVTDTVFSMDGDRAPLREIAALAKKYNAWLMVDEAHAFGLLGKNGAGLVEELGLEADVDVQMGTLSKSAGSFGAYVAGPKVLIEHLINKARSAIFTTALPAAVAAASRAALKIVQAEPDRRAKVLALADELRRGLRKLGLDTLQSTTPIIPVMIGDAKRAAAWSKNLLEHGILLQAIRPPTVPVSTARLRVTVTAAHTDQDVTRLLEAIDRVRQEMV